MLIEVLKKLVSKINVDEIDKAVIASEPWQVKISEEGMTAFGDQLNALMTSTEAKNNTEVFDHIKQKVKPVLETEAWGANKTKILSAVETKLTPVAQAMGIDPAGKKYEAVLTEMKAKASLIKGDVDETVLSQGVEIERLNKGWAREKESRKKDKTVMDEERQSDKLNTFLLKEIDREFPFAAAYEKPMVKESMQDGLKKTLFIKSFPVLDNGIVEYMDPKNHTLHITNDKGEKATISDIIGEDAQPLIKAKETRDVSPKDPIILAETPFIASPAATMKAAHDQHVKSYGAS